MVEDPLLENIARLSKANAYDLVTAPDVEYVLVDLDASQYPVTKEHIYLLADEIMKNLLDRDLIEKVKEIKDERYRDDLLERLEKVDLEAVIDSIEEKLDGLDLNDTVDEICDKDLFQYGMVTDRKTGVTYILQNDRKPAVEIESSREGLRYRKPDRKRKIDVTKEERYKNAWDFTMIAEHMVYHFLRQDNIENSADLWTVLDAAIAVTHKRDNSEYKKELMRNPERYGIVRDEAQIEALRNLKKEGKKLIIVTDASKKYAERLLKHLGTYNLFDEYHYDFRKWETFANLDVFYKKLEIPEGYRVQNLVKVGDNPRNNTMAHHLGTTTVLVYNYPYFFPKPVIVEERETATFGERQISKHCDAAVPSLKYLQPIYADWKRIIGLV